MSLPRLIAHRGESFDAPENTLAAVRLAWERGATDVEIDVHLTADGRLAVIHDADTARPCGVQRIVAQQTMAALRELDAGRWKDVRFAGERIPTLDEVLATVPETATVWVEVKVGPEAVAAVAAALAAWSGEAERLAVMSFNLQTCIEAKARLASPVWLLSESRDVAEVVATAREHGFAGINVKAGPHVDAAYVATARDTGLPVVVWTVDDVAEARRLFAAGVEAVTTNRAAWMRERLATMPA